MNGGYLMVSKADTKIYDKLQLGLKVGKPILWYESETVCYYIDTISGGEITTEIVDDEEVITYGDIILTKGGKTITVSYDGTDATVTEEGSIANPLMENIKDKNGNLRFIEDDITVPTISGLTLNYAKWSISGTHLMIVLAGEIEDATTISGSNLVTINLPQWVKDKIFTTSGVIVYSQSVTLVADDLSTQSWLLYLQKPNDETINIYNTALTTTKKRYFRVQFDLLIDAEYSE